MQNIFVRGDYQARASDGKLTVKQLNGEVNSDLPNPQQYGFASKGIGGKTYTICNGGDRDSGTVILHELEGAPTLADNEVAVWNNQGASVVLKADGTIELNGASFGGLIKIDELTTKLNALVDDSNTNFVALATLHGTVPSVTLSSFSSGDYENGDVNHG